MKKRKSAFGITPSIVIGAVVATVLVGIAVGVSVVLTNKKGSSSSSPPRSSVYVPSAKSSVAPFSSAETPPMCSPGEEIDPLTGECIGIDLDGDGHAPLPFGTDCNDNDATIFPGAPEIPGSEIDSNCDTIITPCSVISDIIPSRNATREDICGTCPDSKCIIVQNPPYAFSGDYWLNLGLDTTDETTLGDGHACAKDIKKYRIQWFAKDDEGNRKWSRWYCKGENDIDTRENPDPRHDNTRWWKYFDDHVHEYQICTNDLSCSYV